MTNHTSEGHPHPPPVAIPDDPMTGEVIGALVEDTRSLQQEVLNLREALTTRGPIEQAKGILMLRYDLEADSAYRVLVRWSSTTNVKLRDVAQALVAETGADHRAESPAARLAPDPVVAELVREVVEGWRA